MLADGHLTFLQARMKYLVDEWGIDKFRSVVEQYLGKKFEAFKPLPAWKFEDYLGWHEQGDGKLFYGVYVQVRAVCCRCCMYPSVVNTCAYAGRTCWCACGVCKFEDLGWHKQGRGKLFMVCMCR